MLVSFLDIYCLWLGEMLVVLEYLVFTFTMLSSVASFLSISRGSSSNFEGKVYL